MDICVQMRVWKEDSMWNADAKTKIYDIISDIPTGQFTFVENIASGISNWSKEAAEYFGFPDVNLSHTKKVLYSLIHPDDLERWEQEIEAIFSLQKERFFLTCQMKNAKGNYVLCTGKGKLILGEGGKPQIFAVSVSLKIVKFSL